MTNFLGPIPSALRERIGAWERPKRYWWRAALVLVVGLILGVVFNRDYLLLPVRYRIYQGLGKLLPRREPLWTAVVLIKDDEYWKGSLAGRAPIKRDYLADLLLDIDGCDPYVIVLDFDFTSPAGGSVTAG